MEVVPLANHKSAVKRHRQSLARRLRNRSQRSVMKNSVKKLFSAIESNDKDAVRATLVAATSVIAKTATKGIIHSNTANRTISRLTKRANTVLLSSN
jgi:small subunit ribosomal protein S20